MKEINVPGSGNPDEAQLRRTACTPESQIEQELGFYIHRGAAKEGKVYVCTIGKVSEKETCDIEGKNLNYCDAGTHHGVQCNHVGGTEQHKRIIKLCAKIRESLLEIHLLNQGEDEAQRQRIVETEAQPETPAPTTKNTPELSQEGEVYSKNDVKTAILQGYFAGKTTVHDRYSGENGDENLFADIFSHIKPVSLPAPVVGIYVVTAHKYSQESSHSYLVGTFSGIDAAKEAAEKEADFRGGKYGIKVWRTALNDPHYDNEANHYLCYEIESPYKNDVAPAPVVQDVEELAVGFAEWHDNYWSEKEWHIGFAETEHTSEFTFLKHCTTVEMFKRLFLALTNKELNDKPSVATEDAILKKPDQQNSIHN